MTYGYGPEFNFMYKGGDDFNLICVKIGA
jgi:hypothetical protein